MRSRLCFKRTFERRFPCLRRITSRPTLTDSINDNAHHKEHKLTADQQVEDLMNGAQRHLLELRHDRSIKIIALWHAYSDSLLRLAQMSVILQVHFATRPYLPVGLWESSRSSRESMTPATREPNSSASFFACLLDTGETLDFLESSDPDELRLSLSIVPWIHPPGSVYEHFLTKGLKTTCINDWYNFHRSVQTYSISRELGSRCENFLTRLPILFLYQALYTAQLYHVLH